MLRRNITWGEVRAFHNELQEAGTVSPDDLLALPQFEDRNSLNPADDEQVFPEEEDEGTIYSVTLDEDEARVLEFIKTDQVEGTIFARENGAWVQVDEEVDSPTVFEVPVRDVDPVSVEWLTNFWDTNSDRDGDIEINEVSHHLM